MKKASEEDNEKDGASANDLDQDYLRDLEGELSKLKNYFMKFKDETVSNMKAFQEGLNKKADRQELDELEARIMDKLNEILKTIFAQFADKKETNKRLSNLEKQVSRRVPLPINL